MTVQTVVSELKKMGYNLSLEGGQIRYKCLSVTEPPKDKVIPLLQELKIYKEEVIEFLRRERKPKNGYIHCHWLDDSVPVSECRMPCYEAGVKECGHLTSYLRARLEYLDKLSHKGI